MKLIFFEYSYSKHVKEMKEKERKMKINDSFDMEHIEKVYAGCKYGEEDYIYHLDNVYFEFLNDFISIDIKNAIYYHDALEDTDITENELIEK